MIKLKVTTLSLVLLGFAGCKNGGNEDPNGGKKPTPPPKPKVEVSFDADSAYRYVAEQVAFGPRVPGTAEHQQTMVYLVKKLKQFSDTAYVQSGPFTNSTRREVMVYNVIGQFNPTSQKRFVLAAHWDTRPTSDEDENKPGEKFDGANDGASGVGVLIEIARQLSMLNPELGIDIVFFDREDGGESGGLRDTWCIGSQFWSNKVLTSEYSAQNAILLDMVGAKNATFGHEIYSSQYNQNLLAETWRTGQGLGYGSYFLNMQGGMITDDHIFMSRIAGVPTIDIIHHDLNTPTGFPDHWHKQSDNMDAIDKNTLKAVGHTVLQVVMDHNQRL